MPVSQQVFAMRGKNPIKCFIFALFIAMNTSKDFDKINVFLD